MKVLGLVLMSIVLALPLGLRLWWLRNKEVCRPCLGTGYFVGNVFRCDYCDGTGWVYRDEIGGE